MPGRHVVAVTHVPSLVEWALGAIAFELLTGRVPFEAETILELCFKVAQESAPNPKDLRPELPDELCAAVRKCLEKNPDDRFPNVGELARAFEPFALGRDRGTAERALDVLGTGKRPPVRSLAPEANTAAPKTPAPKTPTPAAAPTPTPALGVPQATSSQIEAVAPAAWGTTQAQTAAAKSRKGIFAIAAAVVVLAGVAGSVVASRKGSEGTSAGAGVVAASAIPSAVVSATTSATTSTPVVATAAVDPVSATATATATANVGDAGAVVSTATTPASKPVVRPVASASAKPVKSGASAPAAPPAEPGGFIKVRE
jgi:hypothetical protein